MTGGEKKGPGKPLDIDLDDEDTEEVYERLSFVDLVEENVAQKAASREQKKTPAEVSGLLSQWLLGFSTGDYEGAISAAGEAVRILPDDLSIRCKLATGYLMAGRHEEAAATLEFILERDPDHGEARSLADSREILSYLVKVSREALKRRDFDSALVHVERSIRLIPSYAEAYMMRAIIRYQKGLRPECIADLKKTLELEPGHEQARRLIDEIGRA